MPHPMHETSSILPRRIFKSFVKGEAPIAWGVLESFPWRAWGDLRFTGDIKVQIHVCTDTYIRWYVTCYCGVFSVCACTGLKRACSLPRPTFLLLLSFSTHYHHNYHLCFHQRRIYRDMPVLSSVLSSIPLLLNLRQCMPLYIRLTCPVDTM